MNMKNFNIKSKQAKKLFRITKKQIQLEFNLINGNKNYKYSISVKISERKELNSVEIQCANQNKINLLRFKYDYIFGKEQKLKLMLNLGKKILIPSSILIADIVRSEKSTKYINFDNMGGKLEIIAKDIKVKTL